MRVYPILAALMIVLLSGCSLFGSKDDQASAEENTTEKLLYDSAQSFLRSGQWESAISNLQLLEENFPFGNYAEQAQLELIYAHYKNFETGAAIASADRFIRLHPQHRQVDYAYYMKGLATFTQGKGIFERFLPTDLTRRDPGPARESFSHFAQLLARYPNSIYAPDAKKRMIYLRNLLARYEIHVANYYFKRGAYLAAANRGRYVVENFQKTPAVPDGLAVMTQAYKFLGMEKLSEQNRTVLAQNFPEHPALNDDGSFRYADSSIEEEDKSWLATLTFGLLERPDTPAYDSREIYNSVYLEDPRVASQTTTTSAESKQKSLANRLSFGLFN
ncbi:outer membrane protein assembly factor BamD [Sessilibacter corallicola]|uniref:Outer membrane protein assembly factor BamD n=1 Tax=Sessilibacter corallicola TaxID=2904075 RepID=A0ABQ0ADU7_9GAMM|nr:outer membrane protein assembly factor BamD [Sessilibacter corallicola]MCE2027404.1 outer membrane protein assembly factor BamD [Sessilibacter corallicola]